MPCSFIFSIEIIFVGGRYLIVVKGDGSLVWYWPDDGDGSGSRYPAVGDVDRDGDLEIGVVGDGLQRDLNLSLLHHNQLKVSGWPYAGEGGTPPIFADLDVDGYLEIIFYSGEKIHVLDRFGNGVAPWPKSVGGGWTCSLPCAVGDIDIDGDLEILVKTIGGDEGGLYVFHHNGEVVAGFPIVSKYNFVLGPPNIADVDGDNKMEILLGELGFHNDGSVIEGWPPKTKGSIIAAPAFFDIDRDGKSEMIYGTGINNEGQLYIRDLEADAVEGSTGFCVENR